MMMGAETMARGQSAEVSTTKRPGRLAAEIATEGAYANIYSEFNTCSARVSSN